MKQMTVEQLLTQGMLNLGYTVGPEASVKLLKYLDVLKKWNRVHNLTSLTEAKEIVIKHFLDSLAIGPLIQGTVILDVGTGAGFPGIPLALVYPHYQFTLLDARAKRIHFLTQLVYELKLTNVRLVHSRVEDLHPQTCYTTVVSRAFSEIRQFVTLSARLLTDNGVLIAMKGQCHPDELTSLAQIPYDSRVVELKVPYLSAQRHAIILQAKRISH